MHFSCRAAAVGAAGTRLPAEAESRCTVGSTDGPLEFVKIRCPRGRWFDVPIESLRALPTGGRYISQPAATSDHSSRTRITT
jgi:hypothetical protein